MMSEKILVDINVPREVCERLGEIGYEAVYLADILPDDVDDEKILEWMESTHTPILTRDKEFPENGMNLKITIDSESSVKLTRKALRKLMSRQIFPDPLLGSWGAGLKGS
ncbi:hypothetical protein AKJ57_03115 [candidate division MSBL1 archaeon SCGC-AAA259A05]|uniref:DUF5615 domain-containing protein n=1 Tax=candidate division MSBL1 archaeon SCGC-AAA259A05 TaxID=1698259 RepID=A0A133U9S4_9EURY|nr:hypothetical protein AKJ57_03115 [candidate division MSBL1 archaeon SCGC-AAA259A05]